MLMTLLQMHPPLVLKAALLSLIVIVPFIVHQYRAYRVFCAGAGIDSGGLAVWCAATPPFIYNYVQAHYWNVGFLRYWTLAQLPNILLAVPPLVAIIAFSINYFRTVFFPHLLAFLSRSKLSPPARGIMPVSITPHVVHAFALASVLLLAAHTQIALRLVASMPFTYWAAARVLMEYPRAGKWWVGWSVVWGAISIVLWAVFLPPA